MEVKEENKLFDIQQFWDLLSNKKKRLDEMENERNSDGTLPQEIHDELHQITEQVNGASLEVDLRCEFTDEIFRHMMNCLENYEWTGAECYAVKRAIKIVKDLEPFEENKEEGTRVYYMKAVALQVVFNTIQGYSSKGYEEARKHSELIEALRSPHEQIKEINESCQELATKTVSVEQNVPVTQVGGKEENEEEVVQEHSPSEQSSNESEDDSEADHPSIGKGASSN